MNLRSATFVAAALLVLLALGVYLSSDFGRSGSQSLTNSIPQLTAPPSPSGEHADTAPTFTATPGLLPLYPGLKWLKAEEETFFTYDTEGPSEVVGQSVSSERIDGKDASLWGIFGYYSDYFGKNRGWKEYLDAGGPGSMTIGWKRGGKYFIVEVNGSSSGGTAIARISQN
jgi:hypothetical protein